MSRIRSIKPEFWHDEKLAPMDPVDRLVFLGLISMADDFGRIHDNVKVIDAFIFPETSHSVRESLANLSRIGRIVRGNSSNGMKILQIANWDKHQKVDKPQPQKALPPICTECEKTTGKDSENTVREPLANDSRTARELVAPLISYPLSPINDQRSTINGAAVAAIAFQKKKIGVEKPEGVTEQVWEDWLSVRKAKRAGPVTQTALDGVSTEAAKANLSLGEAIATAARRGWISFEAGWITNNNGSSEKNQRQKNEDFLKEFLSDVS